MTELQDPVSEVIAAVAAAEGVEPTTVEPPLGEAIDPEALEALLESSKAAALEIQFAYRGHDIVVDDSGRVQVN